MKKGKQLMVCGLAAICLVLFCTVSASAVMINFNPSYKPIEGGESFDLDIIISGLHDDNLSFFEFDLFFDDDILDFDGYTLTDQLGSFSDYDAFDTSIRPFDEGQINIGVLSGLDNLTFQNDSFSLATLSFTGAAKGTGDFLLPNVTLWDEFYRDIDTGVQKSATVIVGSDPVPEPSTYILLGCGLLGFIGFRKRIGMR